MNFRERLINSVDEQGRDLYQASLDEVGTAVGRSGTVASLGIRVIKGIQRLDLPGVCVTREGFATEDGRIIDCSAAMVRQKQDGWHRYSGKDSAHPTRVFSSYDANLHEVQLWSEGDNGDVLCKAKSFPAGVFDIQDGEQIDVRFGKSTLRGVLEDGPLTEHIRNCLGDFESDVESIGILLRHRSFERYSDTRDDTVGYHTLYSDGSQVHAINGNTVSWQNNNMQGRVITPDSYRAGLVYDGDELLANSEDLAHGVRVDTQEHGPISLYHQSLTPRCLVTQRDVRTGQVYPEPKLWNRTHRPLRPEDGSATFGANVDVERSNFGAVIRVGDRVTFTSEKERWQMGRR